jgi:tetraacyldisaccharide 4'-kinase
VHGFVEDVLSGRRRGALPALMRAGLSAIAPFYLGAATVRNLAFDRGWRRVEQVDAPVISIGNLTTGGTGKSPVVGWMVQSLRALGMRPGIVSRGYRSLDGEENDEKRVLDALCPAVPHMQNPDRAAGALDAIETQRCNVLVLDDGFQHRRLARNLDIVLVDALNPWGYGALLPRGLLREPISSLSRADLVCITRADQCSESHRQAIADTIRRHCPVPIAEVSFRPSGLVTASGASAPLEELAGKSIGACCAIGNPASFFRTLEGLGVTLGDDRRRVFPDHHHYSPGDMDALGKWASASGIELVVVTRKDLVKLRVDSIGSARLLALDIGVQWETGRQEVESRLKAICDLCRSDCFPAPAK